MDGIDVAGLLNAGYGSPMAATPMTPAGGVDVIGLLNAGYGAGTPTFNPATGLLDLSSVSAAPATPARMEIDRADVIQAPTYSDNASQGGVAADYLTDVDAVQVGDASGVVGSGLLGDTPVDLYGLPPEPIAIDFNLLDFSNFAIPDFSNLDFSGLSLSLPGF
jgi:hypothetical protein